MVAFDLTDSQHGHIEEIERFGSGFQRHFIFSIIKLAAEQGSTVKPTIRKEFSPDFTLLLFEEPEAFLHPQQQEALAANLMELGSHAGYQVVCTVHSPHFVCRRTDAIPAIVRLTRQGGIVRAFQISTEAWN